MAQSLEGSGHLALRPVTAAVILALLTLIFGHPQAAIMMAVIALAMLVFALKGKLACWRRIQSAHAVSTAGSATGLDHIGKVELTASPHDSDLCRLREMGSHGSRASSA